MSATAPYFPLAGGLDLITPTVSMKPGRASAARNYEPVLSGYRRFQGYERFDGRMSPSDGTYWRLDFTGGINQPVAGDVLHRSTVGTSYLVALVIISGSFAGSNAAGYAIVTTLTGSMVGTVSSSSGGGGFVFFTCTVQTQNYVFGNPVIGYAQTEIYRRAAVDMARSIIQPVPGSGPIRGVWRYNGNIFAFRDNAGATAGEMWKATTSGWVAATVASLLPATWPTGPAPTGTISTISADPGPSDGVIIGNIVSSDDGTNVIGFLIVTSLAAAWSSAGMSIWKYGIAASWGTTTAAGIFSTLPAGGRYHFINHNFFGSSNLKRMYGVNGVGKGFFYDGTNRTPISTGMTVDTPTRVGVSAESLAFSFPGGSLQLSQPGEPSVFDVVVGAAEIGMGDEVTDLVSGNAGVLTIFSETKIGNLFGHDQTDWTLEIVNGEAGALPFTAQKFGEVLYMDNRGIRSMAAAQKFGNFSFGTISRFVQPLLEDYRRDGVQPIASVVCRTRDQYWLFFDNMAGLTVLMAKKDPEILPFDLPVQVACICSTDDDDGEERIFFGASTGGYVYELNKGTSFDGAAVPHHLRVAWNHFGNPHRDKELSHVDTELEVIGTTTLSVSVDFDFGVELGTVPEVLTITSGGAAIDDAGTNELYYSSQIEARGSSSAPGVGKTFSVKYEGSTIWELPHILQGCHFHFTEMAVENA